MVALDEHGLLIAHGQPLCRGGLRSIASDDLGLPVVADVGAMEGVLHALAAESRITMLVTALDLPGLHGVDGLSRIRQRWPSLRVLVVLWPMDPEPAQAALSVGVHGCVSMEAPAEEFFAAISGVLTGGRYTPDILRDDYSAGVSPLSGSEPLTLRQREIIERVISGKPGKQIAVEMGLALGTVRTHTQAAYRALGVRNRVEALAVMRGRR